MVGTSFNYKIALVGEDEKPEDPKFSVKYMDMSVNPFDDFYSFCNGTWAREHPIPEDKAFWSGSAELFEKNRYILVKILEKCSAMPHEKMDDVEKMLGDFYYSGMNEANIELLKFKPVEEYMRKVDMANNREDLLKVAMGLHSIGIPCMFSWDSSTDAKNSEVYAMYLKQGGISLPNRDYYFASSPNSCSTYNFPRASPRCASVIDTILFHLFSFCFLPKSFLAKKSKSSSCASACRYGAAK